MLKADIPARLPKVWADDASPSYVRAIPTASQTGITPGAASLADGFPPLTAQPIGSGGIPPDVRDMNGGLQRLSQWIQWQNAGGAIGYDSTFATAIGGYPQGAILASTTAGQYWRSTVDNNTVDPDGAGTNWVPAFGAGALLDGSVTNAKLANVPTQTIKGRVAGGTGAPADLTVAQATAMLNAFVGDSGAGGVKGLVPAPAAGAAAALQVLFATGAFGNLVTVTSNGNGVSMRIGPLIIMVGQVNSVSPNTTVSVTFPVALVNNAPFWAGATTRVSTFAANSDSSGQVVGTPSKTGMTVGNCTVARVIDIPWIIFALV